MNDSYQFSLHETQEEALIRIRGRLSHAKDIQDRSPVMRLGGKDYIYLEKSNVYGVLGPRGAGKSTIIREFYKNHESDGPWFLLNVLDCSIFSEGLAPGTAILLHLKMCLEDSEFMEMIDAEDIQKLEELIGLYNHSSSQFRELGLELSNSLLEYDQYTVKGLSERLKLSRGVYDWLRGVLQKTKRYGFVILLDDFDLIEKSQARSWLSTLMDEMRQPWLVFILTADYQRLENLCTDEKHGWNKEVAQAIIHKLLPSENRVMVKPWSTGLPPSFKGDWRQLVRDFYSQPRLVFNLIPILPRGLTNFYENLLSNKSDPNNQPAQKDTLLPDLAECREETDLARTLRYVKKQEWCLAMRYPETTCSEEDWVEMVDAAQVRANWNESGNLQESTANFPAIRELGESSIWKALKEVDDNQRAYWAELIINLNIAENEDLGYLRNRIRLIQNWMVINTKMESAVLKIEFSRQNIREYFMGGDWLPSRQGLSWMDIDLTDQPTVYLGWHTLIEDLRGGRMPLLARVTTDLYLSTNMLEDQNTRQKIRPGSQKALGLIPTEIWAILLLTDGLDRCCWKAFGSNLGWNLSTYMVLAAALVRSAYAYALYQGKILAFTDFSIPQRDFIRILENRDPQILLGLQQEDLVEKLFKLFRGSFQTKLKNKGAHDALSKATMAFLKSPAYTTVHQLINDIAEDVLE